MCELPPTATQPCLCTSHQSTSATRKCAYRLRCPKRSQLGRRCSLQTRPGRRMYRGCMSGRNRSRLWRRNSRHRTAAGVGMSDTHQACVTIPSLASACQVCVSMQVKPTLIPLETTGAAKAVDDCRVGGTKLSLAPVANSGVGSPRTALSPLPQHTGQGCMECTQTGQWRLCKFQRGRV